MKIDNDFIAEVEKELNSKIQNLEDIYRFLSISIEHNKTELVQQLAFDGKYIEGLLRIIRNRDNDFDEDYFERIKKELTGKLEGIRNNIESLIENESEFLQNIFRKKYLEISPDVLQNLTSLCTDLARVKELLNTFGRK